MERFVEKFIRYLEIEKNYSSHTILNYKLDLEDFRKGMKRVWTSTVSKNTLDEAPAAYKPKGEVLKYIGESVEVSDTLQPVYNFKAV